MNYTNFHKVFLYLRKIKLMALQNINMKGDIKAVAEHLAFDRSLQKQMNFFPCDENGIEIEQPTEAEVKESKKKHVEPVEVDKINDYVIEPVVIIPEGVEIINPLDEVAEAPKKRGRKPKVN